ncbi:MAG: sigma-70 family RNA polymerase sigma factor [Schlesneria sp.]
MSTASESNEIAKTSTELAWDLSAHYQEHARSVLAFLMARLNREDANDVSQSVWCKAHQNIEQFDGKHFRGWIFSIARTLLIDHQRKNKRKLQTIIDTDEFCDPEGEKEEMANRLEDHRQAMRDCLEKLDPAFLAVVQARLADESYAEMASRTGITQNTLMSRYGRAKTQLRECVERTLS